MHQDEVWQVYALNGEPIPGVGWDSSLNNPEVTGSDAIVGVVIIMLFRVNENGEVEYLWQRRSEKVDRFPGDWDFSAGGHVNLGESLVQAAVRETEEEIGAKITADDLRFITMRPYNNNRFGWVYLVDWTGRPGELSDFRFDDDEVSEVKWVKLDEVEEFRLKYAKAPVREDTTTFPCLVEWLKLYGYIKTE